MGTKEWRLDHRYCPKKTGETVDCCQNNGSFKAAVSPHHCPATSALLRNQLLFQLPCLGRVTRTMSVALLLRNNSKQRKSNFRSPAPPPYSWYLRGQLEDPAPTPLLKISWSFDLAWNLVTSDLWLFIYTSNLPPSLPTPLQSLQSSLALASRIMLGQWPRYWFMSGSNATGSPRRSTVWALWHQEDPDHPIPLYPHGNARCERFNHSLHHLLGTLPPELVRAYNNMPHISIVVLPHFLLLGQATSATSWPLAAWAYNHICGWTHWLGTAASAAPAGFACQGTEISSRSCSGQTKADGPESCRSPTTRWWPGLPEKPCPWQEQDPRPMAPWPARCDCGTSLPWHACVWSQTILWWAGVDTVLRWPVALGSDKSVEAPT